LFQVRVLWLRASLTFKIAFLAPHPHMIQE
jgi:hypothetical protein